MSKKRLLLIILGLMPAKVQVYGSENFAKKLEEATLTATHSKSKTMTKLQVARVIMKAGFPMHVVPLVTCLAEFESHFRPRVINQNTNQTQDFGLLQINSLWLAKEGCDITPEELLNPIKNAKCAYKIYQTQGLTAWVTYKNHKKTCHAYRLNEHDNNDYQFAARETKNLTRNSNLRPS